MTSAPRRPFALALRAILLLSGWAVAAGLALRLRESAPPLPASAAPAAPAQVEEKAARIFRDFAAHPQLAGALIGFCLLDEQGRLVFASPLAGTALCPASALKIVTTGAALALLGPEFRFETTLAATAPLLADGSLAGDLVLVGSGDPTFSQENLFALADAAAQAGVKKVAGRLLVDAAIFPPEAVSEHWNWGDIGNGYGAGAFGLNLDRNRLEVRFDRAAPPGQPARLLGSGPAARGVEWKSEVVTAAAESGDEVVAFSAPFGRTITLRGTIPTGQGEFSISAANPDPPAQAAELCRARLEAAGVRFAGQPGPFPAGPRRPLASHQSAPLPEIIDHLHRLSDNLEAQSLFLTIGLQQKSDPAAAVRHFWEDAGVAFQALRLIDGSGLARANMIRPLDLAAVASAARRGPHGARFFESLTTYAGGTMRGKIGGMSGVKTQVGFLRTATGRELTFAVLANGLPSGRFYWTLQEEMLARVAAEY